MAAAVPFVRKVQKHARAFVWALLLLGALVVLPVGSLAFFFLLPGLISDILFTYGTISVKPIFMLIAALALLIIISAAVSKLHRK